MHFGDRATSCPKKKNLKTQILDVKSKMEKLLKLSDRVLIISNNHNVIYIDDYNSK